MAKAKVKTETTLNQILEKIKLAKQGKQAFIDNVQDALVLFVNEYNNDLHYNTTPFKAICELVGANVKELREWLFTYTNMTKVFSDLLHFETTDGTIITTKDGEKKTVYTLKFKDNFNGQVWCDINKDKAKVAKELTNETFEKSLKAIYNKYMKSNVNLDDKASKILETIFDTYQF